MVKEKQQGSLYQINRKRLGKLTERTSSTTDNSSENLGVTGVNKIEPKFRMHKNIFPLGQPCPCYGSHITEFTE